ncbi:SDR family oxidoreductase [Leucobacter chinensis]|uniref:SDR family oxidoreductase n=1 Tax=Leucobacter chinensis TaxID=2851010 RepID=UPI001C212953|nr:NAD(P)H-binding protein [Leucobacter chinensis]
MMTQEPQTVLLLGATGYVGRHFAAQLHDAGYRIRAVVRDRQRAEAEGAWGSPPLAPYVAEYVVAASADEANADGSLMLGVAHVVSALGVTRQKADPWLIDYGMNLRYLELAEASAASSFLYVGVMNATVGTSLLTRSKAAFMAALSRSRLTPLIVNPSGYFSDLTEIYDLARRGIGAGLGDGQVLLSPIHGEDLAAFCTGLIGGPATTVDVGGPETLSYREIVRLAFEAAGRKPRYTSIAPGLAHAATWVADRIGPRQSALTRFFLEGMQTDGVGISVGTHRLAEYFASLAEAHSVAQRR